MQTLRLDHVVKLSGTCKPEHARELIVQICRAWEQAKQAARPVPARLVASAILVVHEKDGTLHFSGWNPEEPSPLDGQQVYPIVDLALLFMYLITGVDDPTVDPAAVLLAADLSRADAAEYAELIKAGLQERSSDVSAVLFWRQKLEGVERSSRNRTSRMRSKSDQIREKSSGPDEASHAPPLPIDPTDLDLKGPIETALESRPASILVERSLDLALPPSVPVLTPVELIAFLRRPESTSLAVLLGQDPDTDLTSDSVRSRNFTVEFSQGREGHLQPTDVTMRVTAPDFEPPQIQKTVRVRPDRDCERQCFLLTPKQTGTLRIQFDVLAGDVTLASRSLKTEAEPSDRLSQAAPPVLVTEQLLIQVRRGRGGLWVATAAACLILLTVLVLVHFRDSLFGTKVRGVKAAVQPGIVSNVPPGKDYALLMATDNYSSPGWRRLNNPVSDAVAIDKELRSTFGFEATQVVIDPSQQRIYSVLREYIGRKYSDSDQLLVLFTGHGFYDERTREGFLVANDSKSVSEDVNRTSFVPFSRLKDQLDAIPVKHLLVVIDACFGGAFAGTGGIRGTDEYAPISASELRSRKLSYRTRKYITSGGKEYVPDGQAGHHSPFASRLLDALRMEGHQGRHLTMAKLWSYLEQAKPEPRSGGFGEDEAGSDFVLIPAKQRY